MCIRDRVYTSEDSMIPVTFASEIQEGSNTLRIERIPLNKNGGTFYYELSCNGYADSGRIAVNYSNPAEMVAEMCIRDRSYGIDLS